MYACAQPCFLAAPSSRAFVGPARFSNPADRQRTSIVAAHAQSGSAEHSFLNPCSETALLAGSAEILA
eukprot:12408229-Alexandrium_andersonii.AAC.1